MNEAPITLTFEAVSPKLEVGSKMAADTGTIETSSAIQKAQVNAVEAAKAAKEALAKEAAKRREDELRRLAAEQKKKKDEEDEEVVAAPNQAELISAWEKYISQFPKGSEARKQAESLAMRLVAQGKSPDTLTSKGQADATAGQVVENAVLDENSLERAGEFKKLLEKDNLTEKEEEDILESHKERLSKAQQLLERTLTKKQKLAFLKAHYVGLGEKGKDGSAAGAYNLTQKQISERTRLLEEAGFSKDERRELVETGLAAAPTPPGVAGVDYNTEKVAAIANFLALGPTDARLQQIRQGIEHLHNAAIAAGRPGISYQELIGYLNHWNTLTKEQTATIPANEYNEFRQAIRDIAHAAELAEDVQTDPRRSLFEDIGDDLMHRMEEHKPGGTAPNPVLYSQEQAQFKAELQRFVSDFNPMQSNLSDDSIKILINYAAETGDDFAYESIERLGLKIISAPLGAETGDYQLGFYAQINFDALLTQLNAKTQTESGPAEARLGQQLNVLTDLEESLRLFHEMNRFTIRGDFEDAAKFAESILPKYSEVLQKRKGVGTIQRLLETAHSVTLSKDGQISSDNDQEIMGQRVNKTSGRFDLDQSGSVLAAFRRQIDFYNDPANAAFRAAAPASIQEFIGMEKWEIGLAFATARDIFNIQQRKAEWVAQSQIPAGHRAWESIPQEAAAKLYNAPRWLWDRFRMGEGRGGQKWFERLMKAMQEHKEEEGWGHSRIEKIRDDDIEKFELPTLTGIRAWWASWRSTGGILRQTPAGYDMRGSVAGATIAHKEAGSNKTDITPANANLGLLLNTEALIINGRDWKDLSDREHADYFRSVLLKPNGELRDDFQSALGVVYKVFLNPAGHQQEKNRELNAVKEEIRTKIWERVAVENPLIAISYLHGLKLEGQNAIFSDVYTRLPNWKLFEEKMNFYNEIKMAKIKGKIDPVTKAVIEPPEPAFTLQNAIDFVRNNAAAGNPYELNPQEQALLAEIRNSMHGVAHDMANVKYAFIPFMNDTMFEKFDYEQPGNEAYARHYRDLGQFASSNNAISEAIDNLGKINSYEAMVEFMDKFTKGITAVHGDNYAKEKAYVVADATIGFFRRGEQEHNPVARYFSQWDEVHAVKQAFHVGNSEAQKAFNSVHVLALDRQMVYDAMHHWLAAGVLGHHEEEDLKKRFGGGALRFILRFFVEQFSRAIKVGGIGAIVGFTKSLGKEAFDTEAILKEE